MSNEEISVAKYEQIAKSIASDIESGKLAPGESLTSVRSCAREYAVGASTVERAYTLLEDRGYIETEPGKGSVVSFLKGRSGAKSTIWKAFLSYAHEDDIRTGGAISTLRKRIKEEYATQTGEELDIFQDVEDIAYGTNWRKTIEDNLGATLFFIPILTPTYLRRPHCLQELREARKRFDDIGMERGIYPVHFVDIGKALQKVEDDDLARFLSDTQANCDWRDLRIEDPYSREYCRGVQAIVQALIKRDEEMGPLQSKLTDPQKSMFVQREAELEDEDPLREIAGLEDRINRITVVTEDISNTVAQIGRVFDNKKIEESTPFSVKLNALKQMGEELEDPASAFSDQCSEYRDHLLAIDKGIDSVGRFVELTKACNREPVDIGLDDFSEKLFILDASTEVSFQQMASFKGVISMMAGLSRDLRAPCRKIEAGVDDILASQTFFRRWRDSVASWKELNDE